MSGNVLTAGQCRLRTWLSILLLVLPLPASAQGDGDGRSAPAPSVDPIVLSAERVDYWDEGPLRWVLLEGHAAVFQGADGLRAARALARVETIRRGPLTTFTVEVYAEGEVELTERPGRRDPSLRVRHASQSDVKLRADGGAGLRKRDGAPRAHPLLTRGFPDHRAAPHTDPDADDNRHDGPNPPAQPVAVAPPDRQAGPAAPPEAPPVAVAPPDPQVLPAQFAEEGFAEPTPLAPLPPADPADGTIPDGPDGLPAMTPDFDPDMAPAPVPGMAPDLDPGMAPDLVPDPLPAANPEDLVPESEMPAIEEEAPAPAVIEPGPAPLLPNTRRVVTINPRDSGKDFTFEALPAGEEGMYKILVRGGVRIVAEEPGKGIVDVSADSAVIWTKFRGGTAPPALNSASAIETDPRQPFEVYLEGHVIFRQDRQQVAGDGDQIEVFADQYYIDLRSERFIAEQAELNLFDSRFMTPIKTTGREIRQFRDVIGQSEAGPLYGPSQIRADRTLTTGSRFPVPGYRFQSRAVDLTQIYEPLINPYTGRPVLDPERPDAPRDNAWRIDARQNFFYLGPVPVFYWPRFVTDSDDLDPPLRQIQYRYNNYFGHQFLTDWSMFKLLGLKRPYFIDGWNLDVDYLSERGVAAGSELGWAGNDLFDNITDPYNRRRDGAPADRPYFGYFNIWGLRDSGIDVLGTGRAIVTNGPAWSTRRFFRDRVPPFQDFRGRVLARHMQSLIPSDAPSDVDFRLQLEGAYISDRHFLEQYYKRLFDSGLDQQTLAYLIRQDRNTAWSILAEANLQDWYTDTQWFPKLDYYRLGDSFLSDWFTYWQNSGVDYANTHTAVEVANPRVFSLLPFDPVSATSGPFRTGRIWTSHEIDLPIDLGFLRVIPYAQGQLVGWDNQYKNALPPLQLFPLLPSQAYIRGAQRDALGRAWGAAGARANIMIWRLFPGVESELLNLHGLAHKVNFDANYRTAYSNVPIGRIGIQDDLDDSTYEFVRRYFAMEQYGTILPPQYDPRLLTLRRTISPITGTTDIQADIQTLDLGIRQRLQTRRGPDGRRRVVDIMTLDLNTTYFPNADRDNFGTPFGQNMYNWEWFIGDRTSFQSYGWFEFFDITGRPFAVASPRGTNDPFGIRVITSGVSLNRPPRGNIFIGYSVINTGPIATSALNVSFSYWLSPKWYSSFGTSYDFGNAILLGSTVGITRIGADWLTSVGLTVDPQRNSYMFGFELTPRLSPSIRFGSGGGVARFDSRFAPTE